MKKFRFFVFILLALLTLPIQALALDDPAPEATAALVVDATYDTVLYDLNAHERRYPASITKVMTALLTLEAAERGELTLDQMITATEAIHTDMVPDGSTQNIKTGETMSVKDVLCCLLIASANESANFLAITVAGDIPSFVALMNQRAAELGMKDTHFANPHGLHRDDHYTTAWDLYLLAREAMTHELFREIVSTADYTVPATNLSEERHFFNTNALLTPARYSSYLYSSAIGIKTGSTGEAGQCLLSAAERDGRTLYCVVLGARVAAQEDGSYRQMQFYETVRLFEWGFKNFSVRAILESSDPVAQVEVTLSDTDYVLVRPDGSLSALLPNDQDLSQFVATPELFADSVEAPVEEGQVLGKVTLTLNGEEYGSLDLVALNSVERSELQYHIDRAEKFLAQPWVPVAAIGLVVLILLLIILCSMRRRRKRRRTRSYMGYGGRRRR